MAAKSRRRATNVSLDADLVAEAKEMGLNLSDVLEKRLRQVVIAERRKRWLAENEHAFTAYEKFLAANEIFGEDEREW